MEYRQLIKDPDYRETWLLSFADEIGNLFQGIGKNKDGSKRIEGTDTLFCITKKPSPKRKKSKICKDCL